MGMGTPQLNDPEDHFDATTVRRLAHDLNNSLTVVLGYAQLLEGQPDLPPYLSRQVQSLLFETQRAISQTDHLLHIARDSEDEWQPAVAPLAALSASTSETMVSQTAANQQSTQNWAHGAEILVVDDEEPIITLITEILAQDGHRVTPAFNGAEALAWTQMRHFDLIISDVRMPAVGGPAFYEILQNSRPDLLSRVLFVTGDTVSLSTRKFLQDVARPVLAKPFDPDRLRELVMRSLDELPPVP